MPTPSNTVVGTNHSPRKVDTGQKIKFTDAGKHRFVDQLIAVELSLLHSKTCLWSTISEQQDHSLLVEMLENCLNSMLDFCSELAHSIMMGKYRVEFGRVERNKIVKRVLDCLLYLMNDGGANVVLIRMLELINVLMDLHCRCADQIGITDNFEDLNNELTIANSLFSVNMYLLVGLKIQKVDMIREVFISILYCIKSIDDYSKQDSPQSKLFIKRVADSLLEEILFRSSKDAPELRVIVNSTLQCLIDCTTISTAFRNELSTNFGKVVQLLKLPFVGPDKIFGECLSVHVDTLGLYYRLLSSFLLNFVELIPVVNSSHLAEMTDFLLSCYAHEMTFSSIAITNNATTLVLDPLILLYSLSLHNNCASVFSPYHSKCFISRIKDLVNARHVPTTSKTNIIAIVRKWMEVYSNHLTNNDSIGNMVDEILSQNLPQTIFYQLTTSDPSLTISINNLFSWMVSSLNSNDISQIHKFSEFLALNVLMPFVSGYSSPHPTVASIQVILDKLLKEPRLIPTLTENKILSLIEDRALLIDNEMRKLIQETEKEQYRFTQMLKALPPQDKKLLQFTEGDVFIKKLQ